MELLFLVLLIFLWMLWGRVSALKRNYEERIENLEFSVQSLKDRIKTLNRTIGKASPSKPSPEKSFAQKDSTVGEPGKDTAPSSAVETAQETQPRKEFYTPEDFSLSKIDQAESRQSDDAAAVAIDKSVEETAPKLKKPESGESSHEWLAKARPMGAEKEVDKAAEQPDRPDQSATARTISESTGISGARIEKVVSLDEPEDEPGVGSDSQPSFAKGSDSGAPPSPPPEEPGWQESWQNFIANVDWEQFTGTKLFAWLGGIALFIGAGFFVKYSIDNNLISPIMRLVIGAIIGLLMIGGSFRFERVRFDIMRQTFAAGGIGVLYSVFFAATLYYEYLPPLAGFSSLVIVSAAAFVLAIFHRGVSISFLGAFGAYITPLLVNTGQGNIVTLYLYLAIVNIGLYQVIRRLQSNWLLLFSTLGTMISLSMACVFSKPEPESMHIAWAWVMHAALYAAIIDRLKPDIFRSRSAAWTVHLTFLAMPLSALALTAVREGSSPMLVIAGSMVCAVALAFRQAELHRRVIPFAALSFLVTAIWGFFNLGANVDGWSFLLFFVYGVAGGMGPVLLIYRHGLDSDSLKWFRVFPVGIAMLTLMAVIINPNISPMFWPVTIALQLVGIAISLVFGAVIQLGILTLLLLISALLFITGSAILSFNMTFFLFILLAGAAVCVVTFVILRKIVQIAEKLNLDPEVTAPLQHNPALTEWMAASPVMGIFFVIAAAFWKMVPLDPHPGMVTMVCFLALALTLTRKLRFDYLAIVSLFSAAFAEAFWILRPGLNQQLYFAGLLWSLAFFVAGLALPFIFYRSYSQWRRLWMSWAIFEAIQAMFMIFNADHLWARDFSGWLPMLLAFIKIPIVAFLLRQLKDRPERNSIIACHGGVMLLYLSATPVLLLENGWLGLVLVLEATALLWLNRRIEHPGLRWVSMIMAPIGLYLLVSFMPQMKGRESLIILNPAVLSTLAAVLALAWAVRLADSPGPLLGRINLVKYYEWLAFATGFYLVNLVVADVFAGSTVAEGPTLRFAARGYLPQEIAYTSLWAIFGAILWTRRTLPTALRVIGAALVTISALWLVAFPFHHGNAVAAMAPVVNLGLLAFLPIMAVLLYLFLQEPWGESYVSVKNLFLALLLITGFLCIKLVKATIFQAGLPLDLFRERTAEMAVASIAGWLIYGLAMLIWPKRLDKPFRIVGLLLMVAGLYRALIFPFRYAVEFGAMQPLLNRPTALYLFIAALLVWLVRRKPDTHWPSERVTARNFWGVTMTIVCFIILNIEIASVFKAEGVSFSLLTRGSLAHQLGYSLGWLGYAIVMLVVGIKWQVRRARQAALLLIIITFLKIFLKDLWSLGQLYRVASFIGLAIIMMLVSYLYQRFLAKMEDKS